MPGRAGDNAQQVATRHYPTMRYRAGAANAPGFSFPHLPTAGRCRAQSVQRRAGDVGHQPGEGFSSEVYRLSTIMYGAIQVAAIPYLTLRHTVMAIDWVLGWLKAMCGN